MAQGNILKSTWIWPKPRRSPPGSLTRYYPGFLLLVISYTDMVFVGGCKTNQSFTILRPVFIVISLLEIASIPRSKIIIRFIVTGWGSKKEHSVPQKLLFDTSHANEECN